ncbi:deaminase [Clostridium algidicarnis]|uniref:deaminase n=1 Tax=Clostridium algidicarnis TaxID=37659 RepID=UPI0016288ACF|nr:deaminase [Clostridium algidicarnis]MBB6630997.1 cytidine deaminase [Clostridium algidicarnis]MBU3195060.1 cytidine deaminase [Clostridium algidicarnis]
MGRRDKHNYYLDIAETVLERGTCLRRNYGSIIVKHDEIISTGYTGAPRGRRNCIDIGVCKREQLNVKRGTHYELCRSIHSEANAIISASRRDMIDATLYLVGKDCKNKELVESANSCDMCKRLIINSGIKKIIIRITEDTYKVIYTSEWVEEDDSLTNNFGY